MGPTGEIGSRGAPGQIGESGPKGARGTRGAVVSIWFVSRTEFTVDGKEMYPCPKGSVPWLILQRKQ